MSDPVIEKIKSHPKYAQLKSQRNRFGWTLSILMLIVYYGYIALIAFDKAFLAQPLGAGVTTINAQQNSVGIPRITADPTTTWLSTEGSAATEGSVNISRIATDHRLHFGRLSKEYHELFGIRPSEEKAALLAAKVPQYDLELRRRSSPS